MSQFSPEPDASLSTALVATERPASAGQVLFLLLGLLLFLVLCALPIAAILWMGSAFLGSFGVAELLERTRGLAPDTFKLAFKGTLVFTGVMALVELGRIFGGPPADRSWFGRLVTRPATGLLLLFILYWLSGNGTGGWVDERRSCS